MCSGPTDDERLQSGSTPVVRTLSRAVIGQQMLSANKQATLPSRPLPVRGWWLNAADGFVNEVDDSVGVREQHRVRGVDLDRV